MHALANNNNEGTDCVIILSDKFLEVCNGPLHVTNGTIHEPANAENETNTWPEGTDFTVECEPGYAAYERYNWKQTVRGTLSCDENNSWQNLPACEGKKNTLFSCSDHIQIILNCHLKILTYTTHIIDFSYIMYTTIYFR